LSHTLSRIPPTLAAGLLLFAAESASASEGGLVLVPDWPLLFALIAFFALLILPVNALILRPLMLVLEQRADRIEGARGRAERLAREAEELLARYRDSLREAREQSEQERLRLMEGARARAASELGGARGEAEAEIERARADLAQALEQARGQLRGSTQELATQVATQILGRPLS